MNIYASEIDLKCVLQVLSFKNQYIGFIVINQKKIVKYNRNIKYKLMYLLIFFP